MAWKSLNSLYSDSVSQKRLERIRNGLARRNQNNYTSDAVRFQWDKERERSVLLANRIRQHGLREQVLESTTTETIVGVESAALHS